MPELRISCHGLNAELHARCHGRRCAKTAHPQTGIDIELKKGDLSVGRDPQCDIFLNDMTVSREHAIIEVRNDACIIKDLNSYNGVWVNDRMVETCALKSGDLLQIGAFCLLFRERP